MDTDFTVVNKCDPSITVVSKMPPVVIPGEPAVIRIEADIPRRPATFYFGMPVQSSCPGGVCPTPQVQRRGLFR